MSYARLTYNITYNNMIQKDVTIRYVIQHYILVLFLLYIIVFWVFDSLEVFYLMFGNVFLCLCDNNTLLIAKIGPK